MGYYTKYKLSIVGGPTKSRSIPCKLCGHQTDQDVDIIDTIDGSHFPIPDGETKWYDHESHIKAISETHPSTVFRLEGVGEKDDDTWVKYFKNGKMQSSMATITFPDFDEERLK